MESVTEREIFELDCAINARGIQMDVPFARAAMVAIDRAKKSLAARTAEVTDDELTSTTQVTAFREYLAEQYDLVLPDMRSGTVEKALLSVDLPEDARELLLIRAQAALTSGAKYKVVADGVSPDGRLRGILQLYGAARTGRWAGRLFQPQNLPRPKHAQDVIDSFIRACVLGIEDELFDDVMAVASSAIRGLLIAARARKLTVADLANIEGRVLAWLADEEWKLQAFRDYDAGTGPDLYRLAYSRSFSVPLDKVTKDNRQIGKVQELALGYQGAVGAFGSMAALYGVVLPEDEILRIVKAWRKANSRIAAFWYETETAARSAILNKGRQFEVGPVVFDRVGAWLRCRLPSGRYLCYPSPMVDSDTGKISYMGADPYTKVFKRLKTYGGKLVENITQAVARDVLAHAMPRIEAAGYPIVLTVHDEVLTEPLDSPHHNVEELCELLTQGTSWTGELPLAAAGFEAYRYRKD